MSDLEHEFYDRDIEQISNQKINNLARLFEGSHDERVAVLGAFDTWPYMDYISRIVANLNFVSITSRYIYRKINGVIYRLKTQENPSFASEYHMMGTLLDQIITNCPLAIINFSVSAAHFIETDWCHNKSKITLGIAYVRSVMDDLDNCEYLQTIDTTSGPYTKCAFPKGSSRTIWDCMRSKKFCPFIKQDISKNVIEYFFRGINMNIISVENINVLKEAIKNWLPDGSAVTLNIKFLNKEFIDDDEIIFTKECLYFMLRLDKLQKSSYFNRASPYKTMIMLNKTEGWADEIADSESRARHFISRKLGNTEYYKKIKEGYVDIDIINESYMKLAKSLETRGYINVVNIEQPNVETSNLISLTKKGKTLIKMYNEI